MVEERSESANRSSVFLDLMNSALVSGNVISAEKMCEEFERSRDWQGENWGWLNETWNEHTDIGQCSNNHAPVGGAHPGIFAIRSDSLSALKFLVSKGMGSVVSFPSVMPCNLFFLASKNRLEGGFAALSQTLPVDLSLRVSAWLSGCADSCWASGVSECSEDLKKLLETEVSIPLFAGDVFRSQMESLLWDGNVDDGDLSDDEADVLVESLTETLKAMLRECDISCWEMEPEDDGMKDYSDFLVHACAAGSWWAVPILFEAYEEKKIDTPSSDEIRRQLEKVDKKWAESSGSLKCLAILEKIRLSRTQASGKTDRGVV